MKRWTRVAPLVWLLVGCAAVSKEQTETERLMWDAALQCQARYPSIQRINKIDIYGRLHVSQHGSDAERAAFLQCYRNGVNEKLRTAAHIPAERLVLDDGRRTQIVLKGAMSRGTIVVPARINGTQDSRLLLDTGSSLTLLSPKLAADLELPINVNTRRTIVVLAGGREIVVPRVRVASVKLGPAAVENLYVGVYDVFPKAPGIQGILGMDFLRHFEVSIEQQRGRVVLTPIPD